MLQFFAAFSNLIAVYEIFSKRQSVKLIPDEAEIFIADGMSNAA